MSKRILAFAASNSSRSINRKLVGYACSLLDEVEVEILDINDYEMPLFSVDREDELGQPEQAHAFLRKIADADAILVAFAEHNGAYTAGYKNLFDWVSRIKPKVYEGKPMLLLATSPGGRGGKSVLELALAQMPRFGGEVRGSFSLPSFGDNFDVEAGCVRDPALAAELEAAVKRLCET